MLLTELPTKAFKVKNDKWHAMNKDHLVQVFL